MILAPHFVEKTGKKAELTLWRRQRPSLVLFTFSMEERGEERGREGSIEPLLFTARSFSQTVEEGGREGEKGQ